MTTSVVNKYKEPYDIYIGRSKNSYNGKFGNPFIVGYHGTQEECVCKFEKEFYSNLELMYNALALKGKVLGCFCKPKPCHGDVYVEFLESIDPQIVYLRDWLK